MAEGESVQFRLVRFAITVLNLCDRLPSRIEYYNLSTQLVRSASSAAASYADANGAEGRHGFINGLATVLTELKESEAWLEILNQRGALPGEELLAVQEECRALCRIIASQRNAGCEA